MTRIAKHPLQHKVIVNVDGSQAEARVVAKLCKAICGKSRFDEIFESGQHIHKTIGGIIYKCHPDQIVKDNTPGSRYYVSKRTMHAYDNGMGPDKFSILTGLTMRESTALLKVCEANFPEVATGFHPWIIKQLRETHTLTNAFGRSHVFLDRLSEELFRRGFTYYQQSTVGDHVKLAYADFYYSKNPIWEADLLLTMHDSITYQILPIPEYVWDSVCLLRSFMERPIPILGGQQLFVSENKINKAACLKDPGVVAALKKLMEPPLNIPEDLAWTIFAQGRYSQQSGEDLIIPAEFSMGRSFRGLKPFKTFADVERLLYKMRYRNAEEAA